jgi:hypothetical protein
MSRVPIPNSLRSVSLNGTSSYLDAGTLSDVQKTNDFAFAVRAKCNSYSGTYSAVLSRGGNANGGLAITIQSANKQLRIFRNGGSNSVLTDFVWPLNEFVVVAFKVNSAGQISVYANGDMIYAPNTFTVQSPASDLGLRFGGWEDFSHFFDGNIDTVAYYDSAPTDNNIKLISKGDFLAEAPTRFWPLEEGSGGFSDSIGGAEGTLESNAAWSTVVPLGRQAMASERRYSIYQDGDSDTDIDFGDVLDMGTSDLTMACLFRADKPGNTASTLMGKTFYGAAENRYYISWAASTGRVTAAFVSNGSSLSVTPTPTKAVNDGKWHKAVAIWDRDGDLTVYVDDRDESASADISSVEADDINSTHSFRIGSSTSGLSRHQGNIADCAWEQRVWTNDENGDCNGD